MSVHIIYYKDGAKMMRPVLTEAEYSSLRGSARQQEVLKAVHKGDVKAKQNLVQMNYSCLPNDDGTLKGSTRMSTTVGMDIDHIPQGELQAVRERILSMKDELGLLMLELSARGVGYHLVFRRRPELSQEENLRWAANLLGVEFDKGAKDITRVFFTTTESELLYLSPQLFELGEVKSEKRKVKNTMQEASAEKLSTPLPSREGQGGGSVTDRTRFIAQGVMKEKGLLERDFLDEGGRHTSVKMFLSGATQLLTREETNGILAELMPDHWRDQNIQQLVSDFYQNYTNPSQRLLKYQENLFTQSRRLYGYDSEDGHATASDGIVSPSGDDGGAPVMPKRLPKLIQLLTSKTPDVYKPTLAHALFPPLATHLCGVRFPYTDNVEHEATLMNCLMASTGAGKGCIDEPIRRIMADIKRRDDENAQREAEWKKDCQRKGANKDRMVRPEGLVIQIIDPDMTKPALVTRMDEAEGHFVYVKLNELDLFEQLKGQTGKQHFQLMCLAFDPGAEYGQTRVGIQSVTARPVCRFNWNACTTILKGRRFFNKVLTDGPISRINFCTIPEMEIGAEQPVYGQYDLAFDEALRPYIENLTKARGLIVCKQADALARKLQKECAEFARLSQNEVYWNLSHRACVIAWLKACVLYVANGCKWEKAIDDFIRWSLEYDLWCKMEFFGEDIAKANMETETRTKPGPRNLLELLPDVFTTDDARRVRQRQGLSNERGKCDHMICQWVYRKYVSRITDHSFKKCR
ncbi:MAG: hypothetical protein IJK46_13490 [Prevotella sp.]|nr:hypothetical protein [Prevotella sp.]